MNRTAAAALVSLLATSACAPPPPPPYSDVTFYWQFQDGDGNVYGNFDYTAPGCDVANVDHVRVTLSGPLGTLPSSTVPCVADNGMPGATFTGLPTGPYTWYIEGLRLDFRVFDIQGSGNVVNFPFFYPRLDAVYPNMDLWYEIPTGCTGVSEILFQLDNRDAEIVEYSSDNVFVACEEPPLNGFTMPSIPVGNAYGYRYIAAVDPAGRSLYQVCGFGYPPDPPLVQGPDGTSATASLFLPNGTCP